MRVIRHELAKYTHPRCDENT
ncbi:hypothetical protein [Burkholderia pseudomallei]